MYLNPRFRRFDIQTQRFILFTHLARNSISLLRFRPIKNSDRTIGPKSAGGNVMRVCLYQKSVCKVYRTEGVYFRYIQYYLRISVFVQSRRVHLFIVNCLLKNKFNIHVAYYLYI